MSARRRRLTRSAATLVVVLRCAASAAWADAPAYSAVAAQSSVTFVGTQQGERFSGVIRDFDARVAYASDEISTSRMDVVIRLASLDTKNEERDQELAGADWFDVARYPTASFRVATIRMTPAGPVGDAELTIKGHTKQLAFPFTWTADGGSATLDARVTLDRLDFGLGAGEWADETIVAHKVEVIVHVRLAAAAREGKPAAPATQPRSATH
jgi:polyisoprenoid-binding protein YceI